MTQSIDLLLTKSAGQPWGFRLQGGKEFNMPIVIQKVNGGSPAERAGMRAGDHVISVADHSAGQLRHKEVQDLVVTAGNSIKITVVRGGVSNVRPPPLLSTTPKETVDASVPGGQATPTQVKPQSVQPPRNRNPFSPVKIGDGNKMAIVHNQHNSPLPLYSEEKIAETLSAQAEVLTGGAMGVNFKRYEPVPWQPANSNVLRMLKNNSPADLSSGEHHASQSSSNTAAPVHQAAPGPGHMGPIVKKGPPVPQKPTQGLQRPGMRSTSATVIRQDPVSGGVKLVSAVDTETTHFNAFNRTPQSFKNGSAGAAEAATSRVLSPSATQHHGPPASDFSEADSSPPSAACADEQGTCHSVVQASPLVEENQLDQSEPGEVVDFSEVGGRGALQPDTALELKIKQQQQQQLVNLSQQQQYKEQQQQQQQQQQQLQQNHFAEQFHRAVSIGSEDYQNLRKPQPQHEEEALQEEELEKYSCQQDYQQKLLFDHANKTVDEASLQSYQQHQHHTSAAEKFPAETSSECFKFDPIGGAFGQVSDQKSNITCFQDQDPNIVKRSECFEQYQNSEQVQFESAVKHEQQLYTHRQHLEKFDKEQHLQGQSFSDIASEVEWDQELQLERSSYLKQSSQLQHSSHSQQSTKLGQSSNLQKNSQSYHLQTESNSLEERKVEEHPEFKHGVFQSETQPLQQHILEQKLLKQKPVEPQYYSESLLTTSGLATPEVVDKSTKTNTNYHVTPISQGYLQQKLHQEQQQQQHQQQHHKQQQQQRQEQQEQQQYQQHEQQQQQEYNNNRRHVAAQMSSDKSAAVSHRQVITRCEQSTRQESLVQRETTSQRHVMSPGAPHHQPAAPSPGHSPQLMSQATTAATTTTTNNNSLHQQQQQQQQQQFSGQTQQSQVDYTSYVPQKKGGNNVVWPPPKTEESSAQQHQHHHSLQHHQQQQQQQQHSLQHQQQQQQQQMENGSLGHSIVQPPLNPQDNPHPHAGNSYGVSSPPLSSIQSSSHQQQHHSLHSRTQIFSSSTVAGRSAPAPGSLGAPAAAAPGSLGSLASAVQASASGLGCGVAPSGPVKGPAVGGGAAAVGAGGVGGGGGGGASAVGAGKSSMAGKTNAPKRGRGQRKAAGSLTRIPICAACNNQIRGPFIAALGQCWCPGCFVCSTQQCRQNLENVGFVEVDESIHCEHCWESHLAPSCSKCRKRIKEDCLKACGTCYHPECFACAYCGGLFGNSAFFMEDGLPYCENDWNELFTTKCMGCGFPIEAGDRWVEALNKNFHAQCFKCAICGSNLEGQSFLSKQGRPFCKHHARM